MAGVPKAVHAVFMRESPVDVSPNGAGPVAAGTRMTGVLLYNSATFDLALGNVSPGLVVPRHRNLEAFANQIGHVREPIAVLLETLLMKPCTLVEHDGP